MSKHQQMRLKHSILFVKTHSIKNYLLPLQATWFVFGLWRLGSIASM